MKQGILLVLLTVPGLSLPGVAVAGGMCWYKGGGNGHSYIKLERTPAFECIKLGRERANESAGYYWKENGINYIATKDADVEKLGEIHKVDFDAFKKETSFTTSQEIATLKAEVEKKELQAKNRQLDEDRIKAESAKTAELAKNKADCDGKGTWHNDECHLFKSADKVWSESKSLIVSTADKDTAGANLRAAKSRHSANVQTKTGVENLVQKREKKIKKDQGFFERMSGKAEKRAIDDHNKNVGAHKDKEKTLEQNKKELAEFDKNNSTMHDGQEVCTSDGSGCSDAGVLQQRQDLQTKVDQAQASVDQSLQENFNGKQELVKTTQEAEEIDTKGSEKNQKKAQKKYDREARKVAAAEEIMEKNEGGFDGRYGTLHSGISRSASELMVQGMGVLDDMGRSKVVQNSNIQAANLAAQGPTVTSRNMIDSQNKVNEETRLQLDKAKKRANITALSQTLLGAAHLASNSVVKRRASEANGRIDARIATLEKDLVTHANNPVAQARIRQEIEVLNEKSGNVSKNLNGARNAQVMNSLTMGIEAAKSFNKARQFKIERDAVRDQDYSGLQNNQNYNIQLTNEAPPPGAVDTAPTVTALTDGQILNPETDDKAVALEDQPQFNPTDLDTMAGAPPAPGFGEGRTETPQGAPGGGGGGVGGTQAAQDDGGPQAPAKTKDPVVSYAANDPTAAGRGFSGKSGGGSEGVGIDQAFADLLKKLLPAEEGAESRDAGADQVALGDRAPASDQAAVIGRNQNIFEVIHKRYLKKSQEGAVLYNL